MIDCVDLMKWKDPRKVVYREGGVKGAKVSRKEKQGVKTFSELGRPLTSAYAYLSGQRVRPLNCHFQQLTL